MNALSLTKVEAVRQIQARGGDGSHDTEMRVRHGVCE